MPKLYEYFGLAVFFYSNEHEPVHVHGRYQGREMRAVLVIVNGAVVEVRYEEVRGKRPLGGDQLADFKVLVEHYAEDIVQKWADYFVWHRAVRPLTITRRIK